MHPRDAVHPYRRRGDFRENRQEDNFSERRLGDQFTTGIQDGYFRENRHESNPREHRQDFNPRRRQEGGWVRENHKRDWNTNTQIENKPLVDPGDRWQAGSRNDFSGKRGDSGVSRGRVTRHQPRDTTYDYVIPKSYRYFEHDDRDDAARRLNSRGRRGGSFRRDDKAWSHDMFNDEKDPHRVSSEHDQQDENSPANAKHEKDDDVDSEDEGRFERKE